ncbi:protein-L-isoaspartate O-methyltransferase family protein [Halorientalis regularis]|jgi:protein-L-isoaspartate(D-aspartate) O-methyltransferase|uniref:protein-L-isoaspartate(D-aspartate) O-methyltransferase n=1 Tax=Halorientalis regularis TaxID=660518 RepID=A0A1G7RJI1_9EURY|nr:protein-L-isoaspartate O-methyltransferase [Halorientalis regularis]SDG10891.1 protein-L-isoaspartate(D-aspartate) O-methyltransferase [Halorientalis regularis]
MDPAVLRDDMVDSLEHESKGCVHSDAVSVAMRAVPRHEFVADERGAYADRPFERFGTRVLAPSTAARLLEALAPDPDDSVLVVGAGVGYTAAVIAEIVGDRNVQAIDITRRVVYDARENLASAGYGGVLVDCRDGADGLPEYAPYDRILLEAAAVSPPRALVDQLAEDGRLVMPLGTHQQSLAVVEGGEVTDRLGGVAFSPMLVEGEQADTPERNRTRREDREYARRDARRRRGWEQSWIDWDEGADAGRSYED